MARNYKEEYQHWLDSPALSEEEWAELNASYGNVYPTMRTVTFGAQLNF